MNTFIKLKQIILVTKLIIWMYIFAIQKNSVS